MKVCNYLLRACLDVTVDGNGSVTGIPKALASPKSQSAELLTPEYPSCLSWAETVYAYCKI